jgi:nucleoid-associated protein YgaU
MIAVDPVSVPSPGHIPNPSPDGFDFQRATRTSQSEQAIPLGGMPRALREAAESCGLDVTSELFNEALRYAREGHLRLARERLQVLLCMAPDDGEARLVLARIHVAGQRWSEALAALDEAAACGVDVPSSLRRAVEDHLQSQHAADDEQKTAVRAREQGEVKALRSETRRLRSDNAQLGGRVNDLEKEVRRWAWATAGVSGLAILFVASSLLFGGGSDTKPSVPPDAAAQAPPALESPPLAEVSDEPGPAAILSTEASAPAAPAVVEETPPPPAPVESLEHQGLAAMNETGALTGTSLSLRVDDGDATLAGVVDSHRQRKLAEAALLSIDGIESVDFSAVAIRARTQGARHVVAKGETLSHIAYHWYGESTLVKPIQDANKVDSKTLRIGQELIIPPIE